MNSHRGTEAQRVLSEDELFKLTGQIIDSCIAVHKEMGPGLLESVYEYCLLKEFQLRNISAESQVEVPLRYKGHELSKKFYVDIIVEDIVVLEIKASELMHPLYEAQLLSYLKLMKRKIGFVLNFNVPIMKQGIKRMRNGY